MPGGDLMVGGSKENNHPAGSSPESHSLKAQAKQRPVLGSNNSAPKWGESIEQNAIDLYNKLMSLSDDSDDSEDDM
ncbi:hypothetical protein FRC03_007095 [Tulasnella sp. 419]|nr:hypothetical protein FRC03_007095 [Tulasnella sp. 419]